MVFPFDKYLWFMVIYFFLNLAFVLTCSVYFFSPCQPVSHVPVSNWKCPWQTSPKFCLCEPANILQGSCLYNGKGARNNIGKSLVKSQKKVPVSIYENMKLSRTFFFLTRRKIFTVDPPPSREMHITKPRITSNGNTVIFIVRASGIRSNRIVTRLRGENEKHSSC